MAGKASLFGVDLSGGSAARNLMGKKAPEGATFYDNELGKLLVRDDKMGGLVSIDGSPVIDTTPGSVYFADHFKSAAISPAYDITKGSGAVAFAIDPTVKSGAVKGTTGAAGSGAAADAITLALNAPMQLSATSQVELAVGLKVSLAAGIYFFIGLSDTLPGTLLEYPITVAAPSVYTTTATDAVGFMFDTSATVPSVRLVGVAADVDAAHVDTVCLPLANTFYDFRLRIEGRTAYFSIDGVTFASANVLANCAAPAVNLYPMVVAGSRSAAARDVTVDYFRGGKFAA